MQTDRAFNIRRILNRLAPLLLTIAICAVWETACHVLQLPEFLLPAPSAIFRAAFNLTFGEWITNIRSTLQVALAGYLAAIAVSIPLAVILALSPPLSRAVYPILVVIHSTPIVAVAPIIVVTLGVDIAPRIFITFLISFFPIVISTATGILNTPEEMLELSRSLRAPRIREVVQIRLPFAVPYIFSALKVSITLAVIGAVVAEFVAAERGLGYAILFATSSFKVTTAFANLIALVMLSLVLFNIVVVVQNRFFGWGVPPSKER